MSNELAVTSSALTIEQVVEQRELIKSAMKSVMIEGQHYGKIPGCGDKPSLYQPGAQLLGYLFKIHPAYDIKEVALDGEHREYQVLCRLQNHAGVEIGQGVGMCSSRESKYRYRNAAKEVTWTDVPVAKVYWNLREKPEEMARWMKTVFPEKEDVSHIKPKKNDAGEWMFVELHGGEGKVENPNVADTFNTVLKIAKKRAFVDAVITATASNDLFTQDLEDIKANLDAVETVMPKEKAVTHSDEGSAREISENHQQQRTAPADKPKAPETKQASGAAVPSFSGDWRTVKVHFGKPGGKLRDKELGMLDNGSLDWLEDQMRKKENPTAQESHLLAALIASKEPAQTVPDRTAREQDDTPV